MRRFRLLFAISALVAIAGLLVACGDDDGGGSGGGGEDPQKVLDQTFSGDNEKVESGVLGIKVSGSGDGESFDAEVSGPFETADDNQVPKFDLAANVSSSGTDDDISFEGGLTSTGDAAFVSYNGSDYEVEQSLFDRFKDQVEAGTGQQANQQSAQEFFDQLGIDDPVSLLTNLSNDGTADVEGTETNHVSGDLDIDQTVDAFKNLLGSAALLGQLGGNTSQLPSPDEVDQVKDAVKEAHFDIYSGVDDHILRRLTIALSVEPPDEATVDLDFDFTLSAVNESQTIEAPSGAKPFSDLLQELGVPPGALGALGALGGGGLGDIGGGSGGGGEIPALPGGGSVDAGQAQEYLNCISQAGSAADLQQCQSLAP